MTYPNYNNNYNGNYFSNYQPQNNVNWVQGEASARSWMVAPNSTVLLMDSEAERFYIKSADASGMPSLRIFDYKEATVSNSGLPISKECNYITRDELEPILAKIDALEGKLKPARKGKDAESDI